MTPFAISALVLIAAAVIALGFWLFSEPDEEAIEQARASAEPYDSMYAWKADRIDQERRK
jgi:Tfp pilus assembly protein PilO